MDKLSLDIYNARVNADDNYFDKKYAESEILEEEEEARKNEIDKYWSECNEDCEDCISKCCRCKFKYELRCRKKCKDEYLLMDPFQEIISKNIIQNKSALQNKIEIIKSELKELEENLKKINEKIENNKNLVINKMLENDIKQVKKNNITFNLKSKISKSTKLIDINLVPEEFIRTKKELDKVEVKKFMSDTGVIIPGTDIEENITYTLEITNGIDKIKL